MNAQKNNNVSEQNNDVKNLKKEKRQKEAEQSQKIRRKKIQTASLNRQVVKSGFINQKNNVQSSKHKLKQAKADLKNQKKDLKAKKKNLKKANKETKKAGKKHLGLPTSILISIFFTFGVLILASALWLFRTWPRLKMDELVYEATSPLQGTGGGMVSKYIREAALPAGIALVLVIVILIIITKAGKKARRIGKSILCIVSVACIAISGVSFWNRLDVGEYVANQNSTDDFIASHYADPAKTEIKFPEKKRNLIYIFLESMEMTYADKANGGGFDFNCIPELTKLSEENQNFSGGNYRLNGAHSLPGTTWTMGGMFAATSGLPLQISIANNNMDTQKSFFPGITTIGNILEKQGYTNIFECGSDGTFGGRALYYQTHGNYQIHDINYYKKQGVLPQDYHVWWGFEDEKLISYAKKELSQLGSSDQPFNYTMLTVDTHFEDGYVCDLCRNDFPGNQYANVMACSSRQVTALIQWIQQQPWYDNTTIVLSGDHPTMDSDFCNNVDANYERRVYTTYINADPTENKTEGYRDFSTFDNFPTTLAALGCDIQGDRLGLGTNLFSGKKTLVEELGLEKASSGVAKKSEFMVKKSDLNQTSKELMAREGVSPTATVQLKNFSPKTGKAKLTVSDIFYNENTVNSITADVVQPDGTTDSVKFKKNKDGTYQGTVDIPNKDPSNVNLSITAHEKSKKKEESTETLLSYQGNLYLISKDQKDFAGLLDGLNHLDRNRYTFFIATQGDSQKYLNDEEKKELRKLGISVPASGNTYAAVISSDGITQKEGTGTFTFNNMLDNNLPYEVTSADANSGMTSSIHIGNAYTEYSLGSNGYDIVVWDNQSNSVALQYAFDTSTTGPEADVTATMDPKSGEVDISVKKIDGIPGVSDIMAVVGNKSDNSSEKDVTMVQNDKQTKYTGSITMKDVNPKDLYVRVYGKDGAYKWWRIGTYEVSEKKK